MVKSEKVEKEGEMAKVTDQSDQVAKTPEKKAKKKVKIEE